ncbi:hypothetical protein JCM10450v2_007253 [Rhodotorula kratochvilovae]
MQPPLPVELVERILGEPALQHADLAMCCLVSRGILEVAQPLLYAQKLLYADNGAWPHETRAWLGTIEVNPHLASLVRRVAFKPKGGYPWPAMDVIDAPGITMEDIAYSTISHCPYLEQIDNLIGDLRPWDERATLFSNLRALSLISFNELGYEILLHVPGLRHLVISAAHPSESLHLDPGRPLPSFQLETLTIEKNDEHVIPVDHLAALLNNSHTSLHTLDAVVPPEQHFPPMASLVTVVIIGPSDASFNELIQSCTSLRTINISACGEHAKPRLAYFADPSILATLPPSLKRLELPGAPTFDELDALVRQLAQHGVQLAVLGTIGAPPVQRVGQLSAPEGTVVDAAWVAELQARMDEAVGRAKAQVFCSQRGITLVEARVDVLPQFQWTIETRETA